MDDILIIIALILLNGLFSMSEVALISARRTRLATDARKGNKNAAIALELSQEPDRFLSTIQIGITLIGILTGLYSGATVATDLGLCLNHTGIEPKTAMQIAQALIVTLVTFLSIVVGELVPKRIGLEQADSISKIVAVPMKLLAHIAFPAVWLLSVSTNFLARLLRLDRKRSKVTEDEIKSLIKEGTDSGEVTEIEQDIMVRALVMGDSCIGTIMTGRQNVVTLNIDMTSDEVREILSKELHASYPVYDSTGKEICGIISLKALILTIDKPKFSISGQLSPAMYLPESMSAYDALDTFKKSKNHAALVCDEFGAFQGIITLRDILDGLIGTLSDEANEPLIVKRANTEEWLVCGQCPIYDFLHYFKLEELYEPAGYSTISGIILSHFKRIPKAGDTFDWNNFRIEIVDMDLARIDKIAVRLIQA